MKEIQKEVYLHSGESIKNNFFFGLRQLMELALKALSPGINDPGTAIQSLRALFELYAYRLSYFPENSIKNKEMQVRIILKELTFEQIFEDSIFPIWDYGKNDRIVQREMHNLLTQLHSIFSHAIVSELLKEVNLKINLKHS